MRHTIHRGNGSAKIRKKRITPDQVYPELARIHSALGQSYRKLQQQARVQSELGAASADIFSAHLRGHLLRQHSGVTLKTVRKLVVCISAIITDACTQLEQSPTILPDNNATRNFHSPSRCREIHYIQPVTARAQLACNLL